MNLASFTDFYAKVVCVQLERYYIWPTVVTHLNFFILGQSLAFPFVVEIEIFWGLFSTCMCCNSIRCF